MTHETRTNSIFGAFRETLLAYTFDLGGLIAGFVVASQLGIFQLSPWTLAVYPAILSAKGVIHGLLSGRLGTALHLGTVYPRFFNNTKTFYKLVSVTIVTTLAISIIMSMVSLVFGSIFWGARPADFVDIVAIVVATMAIGLILSFVTIKVAFLTFQRGLDPDIVVYPIMSTIADVFITLCYVLILNVFFLFSSVGRIIIAIIVAVHLVIVAYLLIRNFKESDFKKNLRESLLTMLFVAVIVNVTGTILKNISSIVENRGREIYTVYPALIDMIGDVGAVVGSTATTKLALGLLQPSILSLKNHAKIVVSAWAASLALFFALAILSPVVNSTLSFSSFLNLFSILLIANAIAGAAIVLLSFGISILTFKKGLDPDNFVIPIESSLADSIMSVALLVALLLVK